MKKVIFIVLIFTMLLTSCSKLNIENVDSSQPSSEITSDLISEESDVNEESEDTSSVYPATEDMHSIDVAGLLRYNTLYYDPFENAKSDFSSDAVVWKDRYPMICVYEPYQCKYEVFEYQVENSKATLNQLVNETIKHINGINTDGFKVSVSVHKSMAVVDFYDINFGLSRFLWNEKEQDKLLNSIAMTLIKSAGYYDVGFTLYGGKQFRTNFIELENDGYGRYEPPQLYAEITDEEYAELRATFTYDDSSKKDILSVYKYENVLTKVYDDSVTLRPQGMDFLLFAAGKTGVFENSDEISDIIKVEAATQALECIGTFYTEEYTPELEAVTHAVMDDFIPKEWVEEFIKEIFGPNAKVNHVSTYDYTYHDKAGVYTPPHRGGWADYFPYVFDVKETAKGYEAQVTYVYMGMGGYGLEPGVWYEHNYDYIKLEDNPVAMDFIENKLPRYKVSFEKNDKDELYIASCEKLMINMDSEYF